MGGGGVEVGTPVEERVVRMGTTATTTIAKGS